MPYKVKATGRWAAQGRDANGKRVQLGTFATKREAKACEDAHERRGPRSDMTVSEWREIWLSNPDLQESTRAHYAERTKRFNGNHGSKRIADVKRSLAREFVRDHPSSQPVLSAMFGAAMREDDEFDEPLLKYNVFANLVKTKKARRDLAPEWLTADDVGEIFDVAERTVGEWAADMILFAAETNLRPGELFVVGESDLDPEAGLLLVRWAADSKTKTIKRPKNGRPRDVVLSKRAAAAAARRMAARSGSVQVREIATERARKGAKATELEPTPILFPNPSGDQFWNSTWTYYWHQIRAASGRPDMDFYELVRHYGATRLREAGLEDSDVGEQLGHTDGGDLVRRVYGHPSRRAALERVRRVLDQEDN